MTPFVLAHAGHWLMGIGFTAAPLSVIGGLGVVAFRARRAERREAETGQAEARQPSGAIELPKPW